VPPLLDGPPAGVDDRHRWNRIRDNELEELVVVLFAKVAMPTIDAVGPYHLKTAGTPASPNSIFTMTPLRRQSKSVLEFTDHLENWYLSSD
jgi:hypothetical protein